MSKIELEYCFLDQRSINLIVNFIELLNNFTPRELLTQRVKEMFQQNYRCLGIYKERKIIGICGMWYQTRHYSGYSLEVDHVVILPEYRSKGIGRTLFNYLENWARENNFDTIELNTYVKNTKSHQFYENLDYIFKGRHYLKSLHK